MGELIQARREARSTIARADEIIESKCKQEQMTFEELTTPQFTDIHMDSDKLTVSATRLADLLQRLG